jgi:hypothetical protein
MDGTIQISIYRRGIMSDSGKSPVLMEIVKGFFGLLVALTAGYFGLVAAGIVDFPWAKSKIEPQLTASMSKLKTGLEELDQAVAIEGKDIADGIVYCRQTHPANILHGYEIILGMESYDMTGEPLYIKKAYADYQKAIEAVSSKDMQAVYNACLVFDRTGTEDTKITQEEFDAYTLNAQEDVSNALEILNGAIQKLK